MQYVAFLRGIGPGNPNKSNESLRTVFEKLGFSNVKTFISSGNVLFETKSQNTKTLEASIEKALLKYLGINSKTFVRSHQELAKIVTNKPFANDKHAKNNYLTVTFIKQATAFPHKLPYTPEGKSYSVVDFFNNTVFCVVDNSVEKMPDVMTWLVKQFSKDITTRTWNTIQRILQKWQ